MRVAGAVEMVRKGTWQWAWAEWREAMWELLSPSEGRESVGIWIDG